MTDPAATRNREDVLISKLVSAAKALVTYQVGLPHGCSRISKILYWLGWDAKEEYGLFNAYMSETVGLPTGSERFLTERDALRKFDETLKQINANFRDDVFEACYDIIDRFDVATGSALEEGA